MSEQTLKASEELVKKIITLKIDNSNLRRSIKNMEKIQINLFNEIKRRLLEDEDEVEEQDFTDKDQIEFFVSRIKKCFKGLFFVNKAKLVKYIKQIVDDRLVRKESIIDAKVKQKLNENLQYQERQEHLLISQSKLDAQTIEIQTLEDDLVLLLK